MDDVLTRLARSRVVAVVVIDRVEDAAPLAAALAEGGMEFVEITLRSPAALDALRIVARQPGLCVGVGSVLREDQVGPAMEAGACYVVSPGFSPGVVRRCQIEGVPAIPGVATATEVTAALDAGVDVLKFFPAEPLGGPKYLSALAGPFPTVRWVPTGGITATNIADYLRVPSVLAVGGSWMVSSELISTGRFDQMSRLAAEAVELATAGGRP